MTPHEDREQPGAGRHREDARPRCVWGSGPLQSHEVWGVRPLTPTLSPAKPGGEGVKAAWSRMVRRLPVKEECVGSNPTAAAGGETCRGFGAGTEATL